MTVVLFFILRLTFPHGYQEISFTIWEGSKIEEQPSWLLNFSKGSDGD